MRCCCPCLQPWSINFDDRSPTRSTRLQREGSLRGSPALPRVASTPARTPARQPSRLGAQGMAGPAAAAGFAGDAAGDAAASSDNIRVVLRVRPRNEREAGVAGGGGACLQPLGTIGVRVASHPDPHQFSFDYVAGDGTSQDTIFRGGCRQLGTPAWLSGSRLLVLTATGTAVGTCQL